MNRYEKENAINTIMGYYFPNPKPDINHEFERAKLEAIKNLEKSIKNIKSISVNDAFPKMKGL